MDSIRVSEAPDPSSILGEATKYSVRVGVSVKYLNTEFFISLPTFSEVPDSSSLPAGRDSWRGHKLQRESGIECDLIED